MVRATLLLCVLSVTHTIAMSTMKRILVTGGNKGIGLAVCERLLAEWKDTYVILGSRDGQRGETAVRSIVDKLGGSVADRIECVVLDTTSEDSVRAAAASMKDQPLYAVVNNAGIGWGYTLQDTINTNYFGPRRVNDAFIPLLKRPGGRIVHVGSASGPNFTGSLPRGDVKTWMHKPWTIPGATAEEKLAQLDDLAKSIKTDNAYGCSKALMHAMTVIQGKTYGDLIINSISPGFIKTDLTKGTSASKSPQQGAVPVCWACMDPALDEEPQGRYYGSDCIRSPLHEYRDPGEPPYVDDEDLVTIPIR